MSEPNPPLPAYEDARPVEIFIVRPPRRNYALHIVLFLLTVLTTLVVGAQLQFHFDHDLPAFSLRGSLFPWGWILHRPSRLLLGVPFCVTLMTILMTHEMGHFLMCRRYRVYATLPYFIPAPTLIGTLGAFIRIKSPIRSRQALFDIGIAGPIAGFIVALVALAFSLALSKPMPPRIPPSDIQLGYPLVFSLTQQIVSLVPGLGHMARWDLNQVYLHPTALAAWVGMFATALNLLPGGQLDGGHIIYAITPRWHRSISRVSVLVLGVMAVFWVGWLVWAAMVLITGMRHPNVPHYPELDPTRRRVALLGLAMLLLTFVPAPFHEAGLISLR